MYISNKAIDHIIKTTQTKKLNNNIATVIKS